MCSASLSDRYLHDDNYSVYPRGRRDCEATLWPTHATVHVPHLPSPPLSLSLPSPALLQSPFPFLLHSITSTSVPPTPSSLSNSFTHPTILFLFHSGTYFFPHFPFIIPFPSSELSILTHIPSHSSLPSHPSFLPLLSISLSLVLTSSFRLSCSLSLFITVTFLLYIYPYLPNNLVISLYSHVVPSQSQVFIRPPTKTPPTSGPLPQLQRSETHPTTFSTGPLQLPQLHAVTFHFLNLKGSLSQLHLNGHTLLTTPLMGLLQ